MLRSILPRASIRAFSTRSALQRGALKTDTQIHPAASTPSSSSFEYNPQLLTKEEVNDTTNSPFPINVEINYYAPLRHQKRYGDLVAELQFRCYDNENLDFLADFALRAAYYLNIPVSGVTPLPTRRERWTVIRAPFVHAKSKENFLRLTHKRVIKAYDTTPEVIDLWVSYIAKHSNAGVGLKVSTYQRESVNLSEELDEVDLSKIESFVETSGGQNVPNAAISKRVQELLEDPVFKRHLETAQVADVPKEEAQIESESKEAEAPTQQEETPKVIEAPTDEVKEAPVEPKEEAK